MITVPDLTDPKAEFNKGKSTLERTHENLVVVRSKGNNFSFYIDESNGVIRELVGIGNADSTFVVFSLLGQLDMDDISEVTEMIRDKKELPFTKQETQNAIAYKVYPNPVSNNGSIKVDIPEHMVGGSLQILDMNGRTVQENEISGTYMNIGLANMSSGNYVVEITKDEMSIKKQILVIE